MIQASLDEYKEVQQEKRLYIQTCFALLTVAVVASVAVIAPLFQSKTYSVRVAMVIGIQLGQVALFLVAAVLTTFSLRHGAYAGAIEFRMEKLLGGVGIVNWERTSLEDYPGTELAGTRGQNPRSGISQAQAATEPRAPRLWPDATPDRYLALFSLVVGFIVIGETVVAEIFISHSFHVVAPRLTVLIIYPMALLALAILVLMTARRQNVWLHQRFEYYKDQEELRVAAVLDREAEMR